MNIISNLMKIVETIDRLDKLLFFSIFGLDGGSLIPSIMPYFSHSANGYVYPVIPFVLMFISPRMGKSFLLSALISFAIELPVYKIIKNSIKRNRPFNAMVNVQNRIFPSDHFSFPSGHTAAAFVVAILISWHLPLISLPVICWAFFVGVSRVYLGVHYPTDIVAGIILGSLSAFIGIETV